MAMTSMRGSTMTANAYLINGQAFNFATCSAPSRDGHSLKSNKGQIKVILDPSKVSSCDQSDDSKTFSQILRSILEQSDSNDRTLAVTVTGKKEAGAALSVSIKGGILLRLLYAFGDGIRLEVQIANATVEIPSPTMDDRIAKTSDFPLRYCTTSSGEKFANWQCTMNCPNRWWSYWSHTGTTFLGMLKIKLGGSLILNLETLPVQPEVTEMSLASQLETIRKMMKGQIEMDTVIIAADGTQFPCHSAVLTAHSPVLKSMLEGKFKEAKTKRIEMKEMSSSAVKELLAFLYYWDLEKASEESKIALELLECAHKYSIAKLEADVKSVILGKCADWIDIAGGIRLFFFARNVETLSDLKEKAISNLKKNLSELVNSQEYNELFKKDPKTFKILVDALLLSDD